MNGKTLYRETTYLRVFPDPSEVFANRVRKHTAFLLPAATLSLKHLSRKWHGNIHFVFPIEPLGGYGVPGEESKRYHNYLCRPNWIGYRLLGDKCELACDFRFFHRAYYLEHPPTTETRQGEARKLPAHYRRCRKQFAQSARFFRQHGWLCQAPEKWNGSKVDRRQFWRVSLVRDLGGENFGGNWSSLGDFPISRYPDQYEDRGRVYDCDRVLPQTEDGRDFHYIGQAETWNYIGDSNGILVLFYDPMEQIALTTIDW